MLSFALRRFVLLLLFCVSIAPCAWARRGIQSMDANIRQSDLIVIGDTRMGERTAGRSMAFSVLLSIHTVLKGDEKWAGQTLTLPRSASMEDPLPRNAQNIAVLLKRYQSPAGEESWGVQETYARPEQIDAIKALIPIYSLPTERAQLLALRDLWASDNALLRAQFIEDLGQMRQPGNFDLLLDFVPRADVTTQKKLIETLGKIGDKRALPLLIATLQDPNADEKLRVAASYQLNWYFPGAPGVTAAFRQLFRNEKGSLQVLAARYLNQREPNDTYQKTLPAPTLWQRAERRRESGDAVGARELWWQVLAAPDTDDFARRWAAVQLLPVKPAEKTRLRAAALPLVQRDSEVDNYLWHRDDVQILRAVAQPADVDLLLKIYDITKSYDLTRREIVMILLDMDKAIQQKAAQHLLQNLAHATSQEMGNVPHPDLVALAWLGNEAAWQSAQTIYGESWQQRGQLLEGLYRAAHAQDEVAALIALLKEPDETPLAARQWAIFRLGDLADARAVPTLTKFLRENLYSGDDSARQGLIHIGQSSAKNEAVVIEAATPLLSDPDENTVRRQAVQIITAVQGARSRPLLRRMLTEDNFGSKVEALMALSRLGTPEDLPLLLPFDDFWAAPRGLQYWAHSAVTELRRRFGLDVEAAPKA